MIHFLDQINNDLVMFRPIHINSSQLLCTCQGTFKLDTVIHVKPMQFIKKRISVGIHWFTINETICLTLEILQSIYILSCTTIQQRIPIVQ